ncbi:hypothetical protein AVENLUH5627_00988 [Acinetobacter venetianus]|uniref:Lipoprotein n=1 Tax=Acinetobacter venetianus TaxID=52133 RepID=A0A150I0M6_9GAMM|nr:hypothetical protein [Acinetobacter venetianus]KXZ72711.1 hypothetical protein AVENLUH5627_00988 [Acinetobacter venetianus]
MKFKLTLAALIIAPIMLTACAKKEEANNAEHQEQAASTVATQTTPEQQAAIDAIDKPNLDEKNTDVVEGVASEVAASEAQ